MMGMTNTTNNNIININIGVPKVRHAKPFVVPWKHNRGGENDQDWHQHRHENQQHNTDFISFHLQVLQGLMVAST